MRELIIMTILCLSQTSLTHGQSKSLTDKFVTLKFECYNRLDSIQLQADFHGPFYTQYEEGSIISFSAYDSCSVEFLCGGNAYFCLDSSYIKIDSIGKDTYLNSEFYFSKTKNRYARKDYMKNIFIMYEGASYHRKECLDVIFDTFRQRK